ncbi:hypothetical protein SALB1_2672 [Salinisphaera sp. LB1]|nr:hypothetical protein SALB1_2672 [Salinisphaera sp. LB1]
MRTGFGSGVQFSHGSFSERRGKNTIVTESVAFPARLRQSICFTLGIGVFCALCQSVRAR